MPLSSEKISQLEGLALKQIKQCASCHLLKPWDCFYSDSSGTFNLRGNCKKCSNKISKSLGKKRKGTTRKCSRCTKSRIVNSKGYCSPCSVVLTKLWRKSNPEKHRLQRKTWRKNNPRKNKKYHKDTYGRHKVTHQLSVRKWQVSNKGKIKGYARAAGLKYSYGISLEDYARLYKKQRGRCKICSVEKETLCVDHNHTSGKIRGLLCRQCNAALGLFRDKKRIVQKAWRYLDGAA